MTLIHYPPRDFTADGWHIGIKDKQDKLDFGFIHSQRPCHSAAVFTRNNLPGWPVIVGRQHAASGQLRTVIVNSGNANVATGAEGKKLAEQSCEIVAKTLGIPVNTVLPASTGIIGQSPAPFTQKMLAACEQIAARQKQKNFDAFSRAICTTDAFPKAKSIELSSGVRIAGIAKGAGMIQPNMATMLAFLCTDAKITAPDMQRLFTALVERSFNRITVDSDTSTSDTAVLLANGSSEVKLRFSKRAIQQLQELNYPITEKDWQSIDDLDEASREFASALLGICVELATLIVKDGEGTTCLIELQVAAARDKKQALAVAYSLLNSPLFKTAIYGRDPNWGRIYMAIGKVFDEPISEERLRIYFGHHTFDPKNNHNWPEISKYMASDSIQMRIELGEGKAQEVVWGCDLNEKYVRFNSAYTT